MFTNCYSCLDYATQQTAFEIWHQRKMLYPALYYVILKDKTENSECKGTVHQKFLKNLSLPDPHVNGKSGKVSSSTKQWSFKTQSKQKTKQN